MTSKMDFPVENGVKIAIYLFGYIVAASIFQILLLSVKFSAYDNIWKSFVLIFTLLIGLLKVRKSLLAISTYWLVFTLLVLYQAMAPLLNGSIPTTIQSSTFMIFPIAIIFLFIIMLGKAEVDEVEIKKFFNLLVLFSIYACLVNMVVNSVAISAITAETKPYQFAFSSFFNNRNTFAYYLFISGACNIYLLYIDKKLIYKLSFSIIMINLLFTLSRSSILAFVIFIAAFTLLTGDRKLLAKIILLISTLIIIFISVPTLSNLASNNILRADSGLSGRSQVYLYAKEYIYNSDFSHLIFGSGQQEPYTGLEEKTGLTSFHNTYLTVVITGGLTLFLFFWSGVIFSFSKILIIYRSNRILGSFFGAILLCYLIYSMSESLTLFMPSVSDFIATVLVIILPLYLSNQYRTIRDHSVTN